MILKSRSLISTSLITLLALTLISPAIGANPDDGYPQGMAAPGRTCPDVSEGTKTVSEHSGKTLICTLINGTKKWWIQGEPVPTTAAPGTPSAPEFEYKPKYKLSKSALAGMKVFENVTYANLSPSQRLDIYLPKNVKNPPLLIWSHGGGFVMFDEDFMKTDESAKLLEVLIKNGVAVASVNYRLAGEKKFPAAGIDLKRAIRFLRANAATYGYDPKRFAAGGESAGSYLAIMAGLTGNQSSIYDDPTDPNINVSAAVSTVVDLFGNADYLEMDQNKINYPCDQSKNPFPVSPGNIDPWFGDKTTAKVQADMKSAGLYPFLATLKTVPTFFIFHGSDDCSISPQDSKNLDKAIKARGGKSTLTIVKGAIHGGAGVWSATNKAVPAIKKSIVVQK